MNRRESLELCLASLSGQRFDATAYEIVVVADGCTDSTGELLRSFHSACRFQWVEQKNRGQAAAMNSGVRVAGGEIVLFVDDDCICEPGMVAGHVEAHATGAKRLVLGAVHAPPETPRGPEGENARRVAEQELSRMRTAGPRRQDMMLCANSSIARAAVLEHPFDESFARIHDVEQGIRLWNAGYRPCFAPDAVLSERYVKGAEAVARDAWELGRFMVRVCAMHPEFRPYSSLASLRGGSCGKRWLAAWLARNIGVSRFLLRALFACGNAASFLSPGRWLARRVLSARGVVEHLAGAIRGAGGWAELEAGFGRRVTALMYHNVGTPRAGEYPGLTTPVAKFERQLRWLRAHGYRGIPPSQWLAWRDRGEPLPAQAVMLVFDDAYREAAQNAFPLLEQYGFPAACMVVTSSIGRTNAWDEQAGLPSFEIMSREEILAWARRGIEFGGHTHTHPDLRETSAERAEEEIARCQRELTGLLGAPPASFAYPFGGFTDASCASAARWFPVAFSTLRGAIHLGSDPHLLPRVSFLPGESGFGMWCRLHFARNLYETLRNRWRALWHIN